MLNICSLTSKACIDFTEHSVEYILVHSNIALQSHDSCVMQVAICIGNCMGRAQQLVCLTEHPSDVFFEDG